MLNKARFIRLIVLLSFFTIGSRGQDQAQRALPPTLRHSVVSVISYHADGSMLTHGTGFFISESADILTRSSLIPPEAEHTEILTADGKTYRVSRIVATDKKADLVRASLENPPESVKPLPSSTFSPQVGDRVVIIRDAAEPEIEGVVTTVDSGGSRRPFRVAASLPPNSSGSPVINAKGEVVGIVISTTADGQNFMASVMDRALFLYPHGAAFQPLGEIREDSPPGIMRRSETVLQGNAITRVAPAYPEIAKRLRVEGTIIVQVIVDEQGEVASAKPITTKLRSRLEGQSEVPTVAEAVLKQAAVDAIRQWKFVPSTVNGKRMKVMGTITLNFHL